MESKRGRENMHGKYERTPKQKQTKKLPAIVLLLALTIGLFVILLLSKDDLPTAPPQGINPKLGYVEAAQLFNREFKNFEELIDGVKDNLTYFIDNSFNTVDDIKAYEAMWQKLSDDAKAIHSELTAKEPPDECKELWDSYANCLSQISTNLAQLSDLDPNHDGTYTSDEITTYIEEVGHDFVSLTTEAIDLAEQLKALSKTVEASLPQNSVEVTVEKSSHATPSNYSYSYTNSAKHTDTEAWACALDIARSSLKSPSTADFCSFTDAQIKNIGGGEYLAVGWVDAQNSYGAIIRKNFAVTYTATSGGYKNGEVIFY